MKSEIISEEEKNSEKYTSLPERNPFETDDISEISLGWEMFRSALRLSFLWIISLCLLVLLPESYRIYVISLMFAEICIALTLAAAYLCAGRSAKQQVFEHYPAVISLKPEKKRLSHPADFLHLHAESEAMIVAPYPPETNFSCSITR